MKKLTSIYLVIFVVLFGVLACSFSFDQGGSGEQVLGNGTMAEEVRQVSGFNSVELATLGTLHISVGSEDALTIEAEENLQEYILVEVKSNRLVITTKTGYNLEPTQSIDYILTVREINRIMLSSSGNVETEDLQAESMRLEVSSSGNLVIPDVICDYLEIHIKSSGDVDISNVLADKIDISISSSGNLEIQSGLVESQVVRISSSGEYLAKDLESYNADVQLTSSGSATLRVSEELKGNLDNSGSIFYIGNPEVDVHTSSSGKAIKITN